MLFLLSAFVGPHASERRTAMGASPNAAVFRSVLVHEPVTEAAIARALGLDLTTVRRALGQLIGEGIVAITGEDAQGEPLYSALTS